MFNDLIGIPYVAGGRNKKGLDCYGLVEEVFKRYEIYVPPYDVARTALEAINYDLKLCGDFIWSERKQWERLKERELPCLVLMALGIPGFYHHVGVYIGGDKIIHTRKNMSVCIEKLTAPLYIRREKRYYKYVE